MPNYFTDRQGANPGDALSLSPFDARHIATVLRMKKGDSLTLFDPEKRQLLCEITSCTADEVRLTVVSVLSACTEASFVSSAYIGVPKGDKMDDVIRQLTELGITRVCPFVSRYSVVKLDANAAEKKRERWQKIALSAAKQSGRAMVPEVLLPLSFKEAVADAATAEVSLLFYEKNGADMGSLLPNAPQRISFMTGAEGGFSEDEIQLAKDAGMAISTLGRRILRCETAPIAAFSVLSYLLGEFTTIKENHA